MSTDNLHPISDEMLDALLDLELDPHTVMRVRAHIGACEGCASKLRAREALRGAFTAQDLRRPAPPGLAAKILSSLPGDAPRRAPRWAMVALAASVLLAGSTAWLVLERAGAGRDPTTEVVSAHVRSLMAAHLADVVTSDQHTVKPWFAGKVDFSPPVADFASQGFPLAGGRLEYLAGHPAAAVVYMRQAHVINLFVVPNVTGKGVPRASTQDRGYCVISWSDPAMRYWLVSDLNIGELAQLARLLGAPE